MRPLVFHFYLGSDCTQADNTTPDHRKLATLQPVDSIRAKPEAVFRMHLEHLGFFISQRFPDLEGATLDVELSFQGRDGEPTLPVLVAHQQGKPVARRMVPLHTLDTGPFISVLLRRKPELKDANLYFTVSQASAGDTL